MIKYLIIVIIPCVIIAVSIWLMGKFNLDRSDRCMQVPHVAFGAGYAFVSAATFSFLLMLIDPVLSMKWIGEIVMEGVPAKSYAAAYMLLIVLFCNAMIAAGGMIICYISKKASLKSFDYKSLFLSIKAESFAEKFYEYRELDGAYYLKRKYKAMGSWFDSIRKIIIALLFIAVMISFIALYSTAFMHPTLLVKIMKNFFIIPIVSYIAITVLYYYFNGFIYGENATEFFSDDVKAERVGNYNKLLELYQDKYDNAILNKDKYWIEKNRVFEGHFNDASEQAERSSNRTIFNMVANMIKINVDRLNTSFMEAVLYMTERKSVLIGDSIFGEFKTYLVAYLNYYLSTGIKAVIVTDSQQHVNDIVKCVRNELLKTNDLKEIWRVNAFSYYKQDKNHFRTTDVLVCTYSDAMTLRKDFLTENLGCVVVYDPNRDFATSIAPMKLICNRLSNLTKVNKIQYIFMSDELSRNYEESIEKIIEQKADSFTSFQSDKRTCVVVWKKESSEKLQYKLGIVGSYIGTAYPIALIATKLGVSIIDIFCDGSVPLTTYSKATNDNIDYLKSNFFNDASINMNEIIRLNDIRAYEKRNVKFIILYDNNYNMISLVEKWIKYGGNTSSMIHVISKPYMFRDYFAANLREMVMAPSEIKRVSSYGNDDLTGQCAHLLINLYENSEGRCSDDILSWYNGIFEKTETEADLEKCLEKILFTALPGYKITSIYNIFSLKRVSRFDNSGEKNCFVNYYQVSLISESVYKDICSKHDYLKLCFTGTEKVKTLNIHSSDVFNHFLFGQLHSIDGELCFIEDIKGSMVYASKASPKDVPEYVNIAKYSAKNYSEEILYKNIEKYSVYSIQADIDITIEGYFEFTNGNKFRETKTDGFSEIRLPEGIKVKRNNRHGIKIVLDVHTNKAKIEMLFAAMFNECLKTLYPNNCKDIITCVAKNEEYDALIKEAQSIEKDIAKIVPAVDFNKSTEAAESAKDNRPVIYIFETACLEKNILSGLKVKDHIQNILDIMYKYLSWELSTEERNSEEVAIEDEEGAGSSKSGYLKYGLEHYPSIFDIDGLFEYLCAIRTNGNVENPKEIISEDIINGADICPYCGRKIFTEIVKTSDGKVMCDRCSKMVIRRNREITMLLQDAKKKVESRYDVKIPRVNAFRFKGHNEITKATGNPAVLGFYESKKKELWVETHAPKTFIQATIIHEMVHAWQDKHLDFQNVPLWLLEGHATYVQVEMMRAVSEEAYADYIEKILEFVDGGKENPYYVGYSYLRKAMEQVTNETIFDVVKRLAREEKENRPSDK